MFGLQTNLSRTILMALAILASVGAIGYQMWQSRLFSGQGANLAQDKVAPPASAPANPQASAPKNEMPPVKSDAPNSPSEVKSAALNPSSAAENKSASEVKPDKRSPEFDVVRVEESGDAVVAGRAAPNSNIVLLNKGQEIARTKSDSNGQFVILPPALPPGEHLLALSVDQNGARQESTQNVTVSVPVKTAALSKEEAKPLVALSEPDKPTRLLSEAPKTPAPSQQAKLETPSPNVTVAPTNTPTPPAVTSLRFRIVEADEKGAFFASGFGPSGGLIRLYLNDAPVASVTVGPDQQWSLKIEKGLIKGTYRVRADLISPNDGSVVARVEVPFDYTPVIATAPVEALPAAQIQTKPQDAAAAAPAANAVSAPAVVAQTPVAQTPVAQAPVVQVPSVQESLAPQAGLGAATLPAPADPANVVVKEIATVTVMRGDNLWRISRKLLGRGTRYTQIYEANTAQIRDPSLIYPNQVFVMPNKVE